MDAKHETETTGKFQHHDHHHNHHHHHHYQQQQHLLLLLSSRIFNNILFKSFDIFFFVPNSYFTASFLTLPQLLSVRRSCISCTQLRDVWEQFGVSCGTGLASSVLVNLPALPLWKELFDVLGLEIPLPGALTLLC
jgi:hypothetical protein